MSVNHAVTITLNGSKVSVDKEKVTLKRKNGDKVTWTIQGDHPFAIVVERHDDAFPGAGQKAETMWGNGNKPVVAASKPGSVEDTYEYSVVVWNGTQQVILDPEIVIVPN